MVLEQASGKVLFERQSSISASISTALCFGFSADGHLVLADMSKSGGLVDAYFVGQR